MENLFSSSLQVFVQTVQQLSLAHDTGRVMEIVCSAARALTQADGATFILREGQQCFYAHEDAVAPLYKGSRFPMTASIGGWAMLNKKPVVMEDVVADAEIQQDIYQSAFVKSLVIIPVGPNDPIAAIGSYWATQRMPTAQEVWLLQSLADITAGVMENVNRVNRLEERVREKTLQLEAANKEMETFTYTVAHDLRAPLRRMTSYTSMLQEGHALSEEHKRITHKIMAGGIKMADLIEQLLHFYRSQRYELDKVPVSVKTLVDELVEEIKGSHVQRAIIFNIHPMPDAAADLAQIRQVWTNLLSNAVKYTANTEQAVIEIGGEKKEENIVYYIRDNGIGFDMAYYEKLFDVLKRLPGAEQFEGSGIGLASVQRIVLRHGGKVWAESKEGEGATFYFSLPVAVND